MGFRKRVFFFSNLNQTRLKQSRFQPNSTRTWLNSMETNPILLINLDGINDDGY